LRAAPERTALPFVRDACLAAAERSELLRRPAAACAWAPSARLEAEPCGSRASTRLVALLRRAPPRRDEAAP